MSYTPMIRPTRMTFTSRAVRVLRISGLLSVPGFVVSGLWGCAESSGSAYSTASIGPAATQPASEADLERATSAYWQRQPDAAAVIAPSFDPLWAAAGRTVKDLGFSLDRVDPRAGLLTSQPLVSQQLFEPWKSDVASLHDLAQSTLQTVRRSIRIEVAPRDDGTFQLTPKVVVERYSFAEHRITSATQYREVFALTPEEATRRRDLQRNPTQAPSAIPPPDYWYPFARDPHLELRIAERISEKVQGGEVREE